MTDGTPPGNRIQRARSPNAGTKHDPSQDRREADQKGPEATENVPIRYKGERRHSARQLPMNEMEVSKKRQIRPKAGSSKDLKQTKGSKTLRASKSPERKANTALNNEPQQNGKRHCASP